MRMPGFSAEASLYEARVSYESEGIDGRIGEAVYPALAGLGVCDHLCLYDCQLDCSSCFKMPFRQSYLCYNKCQNQNKVCIQNCCRNIP